MLLSCEKLGQADSFFIAREKSAHKIHDKQSEI